MLGNDGYGGAIKVDPLHPMAPRAPQFPAKAKNVIYLFMAGGPSQLELFDDKPKLRELTGQAPPPSLLEGKRFAFLKGNETLLGSQRKFDRIGQCGMTMSELLPHLRGVADELCWVQGDDDGCLQSRAGQALHEHRLPGARPREHGLVGHLWARQRVARSAGLCRLAERTARPARRRDALEQRLPPDLVSRRAVPQFRRRDPEFAQSERHRAGAGGGLLQDRQRAQPGAPRRGRRPGNHDAHQRLRDGRAHADERAGADGSGEGIARDAGALRRGAGQAELRRELPARAPADRARRPLRAALSHRLGSPRRHREQPQRRARRALPAKSIAPAPRSFPT